MGVDDMDKAEMSVLIGIAPGDDQRFCAGATRGEARLALDPDGRTATVGDRRVAVGSRSVVGWWNTDGGEVALCDPAAWARPKPRDDAGRKELAAADRAVAEAVPHAETYSGSGAGIGFGVVMRVDPGVVVGVLERGYRGRTGPWITVFRGTAEGIEIVAKTVPIREWRAAHAPVEEL